MRNRLLILLLAALAVTGCASMRAPARLDRLVNRVERNADRYTLRDWEKVNRKYESLVKEYIQNYRKYTSEEKRTAMAAIGRYHGLLVDHGIKESVGFLSGLGSYAGALLDILRQDIGAVEDFLRDVMGMKDSDISRFLGRFGGVEP